MKDKEELLEELKRIYNGGNHDPEAAHGQADSALLKYIDDEEVNKAYHLIDKWYA